MKRGKHQPHAHTSTSSVRTHKTLGLQSENQNQLKVNATCSLSTATAAECFLTEYTYFNHHQANTPLANNSIIKWRCYIRYEAKRKMTVKRDEFEREGFSQITPPLPLTYLYGYSEKRFLALRYIQYSAKIPFSIMYPLMIHGSQLLVYIRVHKHFASNIAVLLEGKKSPFCAERRSMRKIVCVVCTDFQAFYSRIVDDMRTFVSFRFTIESMLRK